MSAPASDPFVAAAWAVALLTLALALGLALQVLILRARNHRRERRRERVFAEWRPLLFEWIGGSEPAPPPVARRDGESFLLLWNQMQDSLHAEARLPLVRLAESAGAHAIARRLLLRRTGLSRLLALRTLGYLGKEEDRAEVVRHLDDPRAWLCLAAAQALVHIDPAGAPSPILLRLPARTDWPVALFATALGEADVARLSAALRELVPRLSATELVRILPLAPLADDTTRDAILGELLDASADPDVIGAALRVARSPALLPFIRRACGHAAWTVRTQGASALGRLGAGDDRDRLVRLLGDREWWVRYRAAQALLSGRFGAPAEVAALAGGLEDRFARDIVAHVLAEGRP